jgi:hypothetical protein
MKNTFGKKKNHFSSWAESANPTRSAACTWPASALHLCTAAKWAPVSVRPTYQCSFSLHRPTRHGILPQIPCSRVRSSPGIQPLPRLSDQLVARQLLQCLPASAHASGRLVPLVRPSDPLTSLRRHTRYRCRCITTMPGTSRSMTGLHSASPLLVADVRAPPRRRSARSHVRRPPALPALGARPFAVWSPLHRIRANSRSDTSV